MGGHRSVVEVSGWMWVVVISISLVPEQGHGSVVNTQPPQARPNAAASLKDAFSSPLNPSRLIWATLLGI